MGLISHLMLIDDHAAVRMGYKRFIETDPDLKVVAEAENSEDAFSQLETLHPDVVIADISMPGLSGLELIRRLSVKYPQMPLVILSMHDSPIVARKAMESGAKAYVTKSSPPEELIKAIKLVMARQTYYSADIREQQLDSAQPTRPAPSDQSAQTSLTSREIEIVRLMVQGNNIETTALRLGVSSKTVSNNLSNIRQKLGIQTDFELAFWAWTNGLGVTPPK